MENGRGNGKLAGKLRCIMRRWHSSGRLTRSSAGGGSSGRSSAQEEDQASAGWPGHHSASFHCADVIPSGLHPVYVGKSRRRYLVSSELVCHPLFRVLVERTGCGEGGAAGLTVVGCEVVLFEHLLWMLENADPQTESLDELVDYYS